MKKPRPKPPRLAHPLDVALGARIREVRESIRPKVTLDWIARECSCNLNQLQKYETGENRVSFSRLCEIAKALGMNVPDLIAPVIKEL